MNHTSGAFRGIERRSGLRGVAPAALFAGILTVGGIITPFMTHNTPAREVAHGVAYGGIVGDGIVAMEAIRRWDDKRGNLKQATSVADSSARPVSQVAAPRSLDQEIAEAFASIEAEHNEARAQLAAGMAILDKLGAMGPAADQILLDPNFNIVDAAQNAVRQNPEQYGLAA